MNQSKSNEEVTKLLASLDGHQQKKTEPETTLPDTPELCQEGKTVEVKATGKIGGVVRPASLRQEKTVTTTGNGHQDARAATGTVTFYNGSNTPQTSNAGPVFTGNDGIQVATDIDADIPAANPPIEGQPTVPAHALNPNAKAKTQAYEINLAVSINLTVKNLSNFSGGQDARDFQTVTK